jgi:hypothetical protein
MPNPFPGMNPWLETPALWRDVHHSLITALRNDLAPRLRPRYFVAVETHTFISLAPEAPGASRYPDVMVVERAPVVKEVAVQEYAPYITVEVPVHEPMEQGYIEVRLMPGGEVVTVIELLSHANKQPGQDRDAYLKKREQFLNLNIHYVEIDLLRAGPPMPYTERADSPYRLFIRRRERPYQARLYPFGVRQPIPTFPLPLLPGDDEPAVDFGALLNTVYDQAGYDLVVRYDRPPEPALTEADATWAVETASKPGV